LAGVAAAGVALALAAAMWRALLPLLLLLLLLLLLMWWGSDALELLSLSCYMDKVEG